MGSKKHKKHHKSEKKESNSEGLATIIKYKKIRKRYKLQEEIERQEKSLKIVLKVGGGSSSVQAPTPPAPVLSPISQIPVLEQPKPPQLDEHLPNENKVHSEVTSSHSHEKHKKSKKKKKKKSSEKEKDRHDRKRKHHHHHHHHREHSHERKEKRKRDHDSRDGSSHSHEPPSKRPVVEEVAPCERPLRDPRTCTLKKKSFKSPLQMLLYYLLKKLQLKDPQEFFSWPVNDIIAPGYSSIILHPMDFSTMRKKIDDSEYGCIAEFKYDVKLMCDNAMTYNRPDTVYYKAAKRMWHVGQKLLSKDQLMCLKRSLPYMLQLTTEELGFDINDEAEENYDGDEIVIDSMSVLSPDAKKSKSKSSWNQAQNDIDSQDDDMTPEEILAEAQKAARAAAARLTLKRPSSNFGFLRQHENGSTTLAILNPVSGGNKDKETEVKVNLEMLTGKLTQGTGTIAGFKEDQRNIIKPVNYLNYGAYSSYAPQYDSMFSNMAKEESDIVLSTYGDELGAQYAESIMNFAQDCDYVMNMVDNLLDLLTGGEHTKTVKILEERRRMKEEEERLKKLELSAALNGQRFKNIGMNSEGDYVSLQIPDATFSDSGDGCEQKPKLESSAHDRGAKKGLKKQDERELTEHRKVIQQKLDQTTELLQDLAKVQHERLSSNPPPHLSHIQGPSSLESELAMKVTKKLTEITSEVTPESVASVESIRKAMGITYPVRNNESSSGNKSHAKGKVSKDGASTGCQQSHELVSCSPAETAGDDHIHSADLDTELREFLETGPMLRVCDSPSAP